ncbi:Hypothetical predicted protein [Lecanosticta acicola]|uniref:Uncharacterized protein n=1 Tax=Lecanosticta acicola TaxID=111012 RepID=A0AAI9EFN6_9PEZI|nr:Hypothetical predicted protein [Lecanosticta acicola]
MNSGNLDSGTEILEKVCQHREILKPIAQPSNDTSATGIREFSSYTISSPNIEALEAQLVCDALDLGFQDLRALIVLCGDLLGQLSDGDFAVLVIEWVAFEDERR